MARSYRRERYFVIFHKISREILFFFSGFVQKHFTSFKTLGTTPFQVQHHLLTEQLEFLEGLNFLPENAKEFFEEVLKDMVDGELFLTGNC